MKGWFCNVYIAVATVASALRVTVQSWVRTYDPKRRTFTEHYEYPELPLAVAPRYRGFHRYDVTTCIACGACTRDCPVDCICLQRERAEGGKGFLATGFTIDYTKCLLCGLCVEACPTRCLAMGTSHDLSCYGRDGCIVDFCRLPLEIAGGRLTLSPLAVARSKSVAKPLWRGAR